MFLEARVLVVVEARVSALGSVLGWVQTLVEALGLVVVEAQNHIVEYCKVRHQNQILDKVVLPLLQDVG